MAQSERSDARAARIAAWKLRAAAILATVAERDVSGAGRYAALAATVVGMFDAGARDTEVATFLKGAVGAFPERQPLTDDRLAALAAELHRAAGRNTFHDTHGYEGNAVLCERCGQREATVFWITARGGGGDAPGSKQAGVADSPPPAPPAPNLCDACAAELIRDAWPGAPSLDAMALDAAEWAALAESLPDDMPLEEKVRHYRRAQRGN